MTAPQVNIDQLRRQFPEEVVRYFDEVVGATFAIIDPAIEELQEDISQVQTDLWAKQDTLVSGTNIKTINNTSILWSGDITITGGSSFNPILNQVFS